MAKAKTTKKLEGWVKNNYEKTNVYNLYVGNINFTPSKFVKIENVDKPTLKAIEEAIERGDLIYYEQLPEDADTTVKQAPQSKLTRVKKLANGSVVSEPYLDADAFINQNWKEIAKQASEIEDVDVLNMYKERAEQLLKPKKIIDILDSRINKLLTEKE